MYKDSSHQSRWDSIIHYYKFMATSQVHHILYYTIVWYTCDRTIPKIFLVRRQSIHQDWQPVPLHFTTFFVKIKRFMSTMSTEKQNKGATIDRSPRCVRWKKQNPGTECFNRNFCLLDSNIILQLQSAPPICITLSCIFRSIAIGFCRSQFLTLYLMVINFGLLHIVYMHISH